MPRMLWSLMALGLVGSSLAAQTLPPLPEPDGRKPHVLSLARTPDGATWVGTYGRGIYVLPQGARTWRHLQEDTTSTSISWGFVHAFAFGSRGEVWYGTLGNGWGLSMDGGRTWANWTFRLLGPEYQYVVPNGIVTRGDTVYVATADGIKLSWDLGRSWREITDSVGAETAENLWARIGNQYVLSIAVDERGDLWISHVHGVERSSNGGRIWEQVADAASLAGMCSRDQGPNRVRAFAFDPRGRVVWLGTEQGVVTYDAATGEIGKPQGTECNQAVQQIEYFGEGAALAATHRGVVIISGQAADANRWLHRGFASAVLTQGSAAPIVGTPTGLATTGLGSAMESVSDSLIAGFPSEPKHTWFQRPVVLGEQPYIDQTYRYGSTMGGNFQQHQGIEFNAGAGTPVAAIANGDVVFAGPAEADALTVVIRHDRQLETEDGAYFLFSTYFHNTALNVEQGERVRAGDLVSWIGNTGRATNDHLHMELHATPYDSLLLVVDPNERYPRFSTNPELWIEPLPGMGIVAGQVWDAAGEPVLQARIYGIVKAEPQETPFSFAETYGERTRGTPAYHEHFAVSDVPPGEYVLTVDVDGARIARRVVVDARKVTWVEFRP